MLSNPEELPRLLPPTRKNRNWLISVSFLGLFRNQFKHLRLISLVLTTCVCDRNARAAKVLDLVLRTHIWEPAACCESAGDVWGCALLLCVAGIYGLLAYLVTQRTRELGLRIALGARRSDVMWLVLRQATWMLVVGSGIGLVLAYLSSVLLRTFLYGVKPNDPWTMGAVTLLFTVGGVAAAYLPARRAAGVDPMQALRTE